METFLKYAKQKTVQIVAVIAVILLLVIGFVSSLNGVRNEGISREASLVAQYQDNQNELSNYIISFKETMGVADAGSDKIDKIITDAIKGRYDGAMEPGDKGSLFSAIAEAYPDLTATTESYAKIQDFVISGREAYKNKQSVLLDKIRTYKVWRDSGYVHSTLVKIAGFPSDRMEVHAGDTVFTGNAALKEMETLVLISDATDAYKTHTVDPLITSKG